MTVLLTIFCLTAAHDSKLWDIAIGRRPYISETRGTLLLRTEPGLNGLNVSVSASLPCVAKNWSWTVVPSLAQMENLLDLGELSSLPENINNDLIIDVAIGGSPNGTQRRRFQRAYRANSTNTVQVDHHTASLLVDGEPWAGWGWYIYPWTSFDRPNLPRRQSDGERPANVCSNLTAHPTFKADCIRWGIGNMTSALGDMAKMGVNMVMPYQLNPHEHDGLGGLPLAELEQLVLNYYNKAYKHGVKVLFHMASMKLDRGHYTNATLLRLTAAVNLIKDHPALLAYYICDDCGPNPVMTQAYNTIRNMDPYHLTVGAGFSGNKAQYTDNTVNPNGPACVEHCGSAANDGLLMLPSMTCEIPAHTACEAPWGPGCDPSLDTGMCHTTCNNCDEKSIPLSALSLDVVMIENYAPAPEAHAHSDGETLRSGVPWEPMVNCDASYTMEERITPHKPPNVMLTNMWMSTIKAGAVNQLVFAGARPTPLVGMSGNSFSTGQNQRGAHPEKSFWGV